MDGGFDFLQRKRSLRGGYCACFDEIRQKKAGLTCLFAIIIFFFENAARRRILRRLFRY
jgi:hypothetical protein